MTSSSTRSSTSRSSSSALDDDSVRAYYNSCRHRGMKLVEGSGSRRSFVCPFHGWCWGLDGANTFVLRPEVFDEGNLGADDLRLVPVRCELWGGCAWINLDDSAPPLRECIEPFASKHDEWKVGALRTEWWKSCLLPVNWKLATEAFMEGYHVPQTHPQLLPSSHSRGGVVRAPHHRDEPALHAHPRLRHGRDDPRERRPDRRRAAAHVAPGRSRRGDGGLARRGQRGGHEVAPGPRLRLSRPERSGSTRGHRPDRVLLPALLHPAAVQQRVVVPDPPARPRGDALRDLVADPLSGRPLTRETHRHPSRWLPTTRAGRRSRPRTSPTCRVSRKACTPRDSTSCGCRRRSKG